ncbi:aspartate carbamoyltransferase [Candidatus Peregrinibacteria bacterium]|nr:aspartate carbamoyltransferase [Candidatus Peregrinibacteria bacterium]
MERTQLTTSANLTREEVDFFMEEAERLRGKNTEDLKGKVVATVFLEPSTRTRLSFETAAHRLGSSVITIADPKTSSVTKGETLADTIRVVDKYADIIVMRHPTSGAAEEAINYTDKPFLNAGDGPNQHPTQSLLDIYTIKREVGGIDGKTIAFIGDLKYGRTVHSLTYILCLYNPKKVIYISPNELRVPEKYIQMLKDKGIEFEETNDLDAKMPEIDVVYMTRIQQERFESEAEYVKLKGSYIMTPETVKLGKESLRILHPLPRVDEITPEVDDMIQSACFRQVENGVYMRMALLKNLSKNYYK